MASRKLNIVVSGMIAGDPGQGGATWAVLQYVLGLRRLGHDVALIEPLSAQSVNPLGGALAESANATYFRDVSHQFDLHKAAALLLVGSEQTYGVDYGELRSLTQRADVLINISGMLTDEQLIGRIPLRVYLDLDPAFIQLWQATQNIDMRFAAHTHFVTVGLALGQSDCSVPTCGLSWIPTLQPIVLDQWPLAGQIRYDALTTIANWRGYGSVEHDGLFYGQKAHSLRQFMNLPLLTREQFVLALAIHPNETKDLESLRENRWQLIDPGQVTSTPAEYQRFIQSSKAEFGIAKSGYVVSRCGWFSDRSVCYLASGRPVIAQDTGFSRFLPTGEGLFAFNTADEALHAIDQMNENYDFHRHAARHIAEEHFDSDKVLTNLLQRVGAI